MKKSRINEITRKLLERELDLTEVDDEAVQDWLKVTTETSNKVGHSERKNI